MLAQETVEGMDIAFSEEELLRDNTRIVSTTVKEATTAVHRVACKEMQDKHFTQRYNQFGLRDSQRRPHVLQHLC